VHPDTCRRLAERAAAGGIRLIDAPVSGGGPAAEAGRLLVMAGGEESTVDFCRPVFVSFANPVVYLGPVGSGQVAKLLDNAAFTAHQRADRNAAGGRQRGTGADERDPLMADADAISVDPDQANYPIIRSSATRQYSCLSISARLDWYS
jgi:NAD binding domain of 6-phosphogluconate dehydrogenase